MPDILRKLFEKLFKAIEVRIPTRRQLVQQRAHRRTERWFLRFLQKLLENDGKTLKLLKTVPFSDKPPHYVRARFYHYEFTTPEVHRATGHWWRRNWIGDYVSPLNRSALNEL